MANEKELTCAEKIISDDYMDLIVYYKGNIVAALKKYNAECFQIIDDEYVMLYINITNEDCKELYKKISLDDVTVEVGPYGKSSISKSGILYFHTQPYIPLTGEGVLIGIIDSGIDYTHQVFRYKDNTSKIVSIWDQTSLGNPPERFLFGTEYTNEIINEALNSDDSYSIVPEIDETGHGTFLAGIAAGLKIEEQNFVGAAPSAELVVVKLKQVKKCTRILDNFFATPLYQDGDVMLGINYIQDVAESRKQPLVIIIGLGSNIGRHDGNMLLERYMDKQSRTRGTVFTVAAGNEANLGHHYYGEFNPTEKYQDIELNIAKNDNAYIAVYNRGPDLFSLEVFSPAGDYISRSSMIPVSIKKIEVISFALEETKIRIIYVKTRVKYGDQIIFVWFFNPYGGIWVIRLFGDLIINGKYDIWLPREGWIKKETQFLQPDPYTTITFPSMSSSAITVGAYNHIEDKLYVSSGRGLTQNDKQKPDLVAPGVNVFGPLPDNKFGTMTGTSISAAITGGACALLLEWGDVLGNYKDISPQLVKIWLQRGAIRNEYLVYPNREWGYGILNLEQSFNILKEIYFD